MRTISGLPRAAAPSTSRAVDALSITPPGGATDFTGDQLTGVQAHPQLELHTVAVVDFNGESLGLFLDAQGRQAGANSMVLQRHWRAEDRHDAVAGELAQLSRRSASPRLWNGPAVRP